MGRRKCAATHFLMVSFESYDGPAEAAVMFDGLSELSIWDYINITYAQHGEYFG